MTVFAVVNVTPPVLTVTTVDVSPSSAMDAEPTDTAQFATSAAARCTVSV